MENQSVIYQDLAQFIEFMYNFILLNGIQDRVEPYLFDKIYGN